MKFLPVLVIGGLCVVRLHALESAEVAAVAKRFDNPVTGEQYQARMDLNRLVANATVPGKGDTSAVTKVLVSVIQSPDTSTEAVKYLLRALARVATADAIEPLAKILAGDNAMLREEAREALSWIPDPKAAAALESALAKTSDKQQKAGLIAALATQKSATSVPVLAPLILDPDADVSRAAVDAVARIGGATAVSSLTTAYGSDKLSAALKPEVENALLVASAGDPKITNGIYQSTKFSPIKVAAFIALMGNAPESAKSALIEAALKSEDAGLRHAALARGIAINLPALQSSLAQSIGKMPEDDRLIVLANLHHLKPVESAEKIAISCMAASGEDERIAAISALGKIGTKSAFDAVMQAVAAREPKINQAASNALGSMTYPAATSSLLAMLKGDSSPDKILAIKAMNSVQVPDAGAVLIGVIKGPDPAASKEAMKTLYFIASIEDLRVLSADAAAATDAELRKELISISSRIANRFNTEEARALVKELK